MFPIWGQWSSSGVGCVPSMCGALGFVPSTKGKQTKPFFISDVTQQWASSV